MSRTGVIISIGIFCIVISLYPTLSGIDLGNAIISDSGFFANFSVKIASLIDVFKSSSFADFFSNIWNVFKNFFGGLI